jgi:hypothetical protein
MEIAPGEGRHALSQQMIVVKIERLRARERSLDRAALAEETAAIAAEQRAVRGNFVFLMGGHVEDEEAEAEQSSDIQEGRLQNSARREISSAIDLMSRSEQGLSAMDTGAALPPARMAVAALQRAFGRSRYILRALPSRSRIDPARRLTGDLSRASAWKRVLFAHEGDRREQAERDLLAMLMRLTAGQAPGRRASAALIGTLAEEALAIDPTRREWQQIARDLEAAAAAVRAEEWERVSLRLGTAVAAVATETRRSARTGANPALGRPSRLFSAWAEAAK